MRFSPEQLSDPKRFDELRQDKEAFSCLAELEYRDDLSHVELCRLAQYLLSTNDVEGSWKALGEARELDETSLYLGAYLSYLAHVEDFKGMASVMQTLAFGSKEPLDIEGYSLIFEMISFYYVANLEDYHQTTAMLCRAEAYASFLGLEYRLGIINSKLEYTANLIGTPFIPNPLLSGSDKTSEVPLRVRFSTLLINQSVEEANRLTLAGKLEKAELTLVQATRDYALALEGEASCEQIAKQITDTIPEHFQSKLYWSLLMLQLFSAIGKSSGRSHPERIISILSESLSDFVHLSPTMTLAAKIYPLGVSMAARLDQRIKPHINDVITLQNERYRDGFNLADKIIVGVTKPVREAIILDELYGTTEHLRAVTKKPLGHPQNKLRLEKSMKDANISRSNFVSVGGTYRSLYCLGEALADSRLKNEAQSIYQGSTFLKEVTNPRLLNF